MADIDQIKTATKGRTLVYYILSFFIFYLLTALIKYTVYMIDIYCLFSMAKDECTGLQA